MTDAAGQLKTGPTAPAHAGRREGQTAAEWQSEIFDEAVREDPVAAFGVGPLQEMLWRKRIELATRYASADLPYLDIGSGNGRVTEGLADTVNSQVIGIDVSQECVRFASAHTARPNVSYECASVEDFTPTTKFGLVTMYEVLEHLDDPVAAMRRIAEWLLPRGYLIFSTPNRSSLNRRLKGLPGVRNLYAHLSGVAPDSVSPGHVEEYHYDELINIVRQAGLTVDQTLGAVLLLPFPYAVAALARRPGFARLNVRSGDWYPRLAGHLYLVAQKPD